MSKISDLFYYAAERFQNDRNAREDMFKRDMRSIEGYRGDKYYDDKSAQFRKYYEADLNALRAEAKHEISSLLERMRGSIAKIPVSMPSTDQINLITLLSMREKITQSELDNAARALVNCPSAIKMLDEIANKNRENGNPLIGASHRFSMDVMNRERAEETIDENGIDDFLKYNTSRSARISAKYNRNHYGVDIEMMARRKTFNTKEECFRELFGIDGEAYTKFCEMIDAE